MRLVVELAKARGTPAIVNIHDVALARSFADRSVGLAGGTVAFDGAASEVTDQVLTEIYGEEDWSATIKRNDGGDEEDTEENHSSHMNKETSAG